MKGFALYRSGQSLHFAGGEVERLEGIPALDGREGFVMAPFRQSAAHPVVLIRPDVTAVFHPETSSPAGTQAISSAERDRIGRLIAPFFAEPASGDVPSETSAAEEAEAYREAFARFIAPIRAGRFRKLVLSHSSSRSIGTGISPIDIFFKACKAYPHMFVYLCHTPVTGTWLGSTPEILLSGHARKWHTMALAGTMPIAETMPIADKGDGPEGNTHAEDGDRDAPTAMGWDRKNIEEQEFVAGYIREMISRFATDITEHGPYTSTAGHLAHLRTDFDFNLGHAGKDRIENAEDYRPADKDDNETCQIGELLKALHPTPAVCGLPKEEAFRFIAGNEGYDREYYSGFVGYMNSGGKPDIHSRSDESEDGHAGLTELYVNLRCMKLDCCGDTEVSECGDETGQTIWCAKKATLYAGGGILPASDPEMEWNEVKMKMETVGKLV